MIDLLLMRRIIPNESDFGDFLFSGSFYDNVTDVIFGWTEGQ